MTQEQILAAMESDEDEDEDEDGEADSDEFSTAGNTSALQAAAQEELNRLAGLTRSTAAAETGEQGGSKSSPPKRVSSAKDSKGEKDKDKDKKKRTGTAMGTKAKKRKMSTADSKSKYIFSTRPE